MKDSRRAARSMYRERCTLLENKKVAPGHFVMTFRSSRISKKARPGQFVQILCRDSFEPLLPRPFSFLSASGSRFSVLYHVVGKGTALLAEKNKGESLWVLGPLGNGFSLGGPPEKICIGGGVGIPPLYHLVREWIRRKEEPPEKIHVLLGARDKSLLLCERDFKKLGVRLAVATNNGSKGRRGFVTDLLADRLNRTPSGKPAVYTCGPTPMLKAVSSICRQKAVPCEVSVEVPMACGFGACLGCAIKVGAGSSHRFAVACCEGPVFKGEEIRWD